MISTLDERTKSERYKGIVGKISRMKLSERGGVKNLGLIERGRKRTRKE